jgi:dolichol-phosphate mannosyltransferase
MLNKKKISIVIPAWNEYENLVEIHSRLDNIEKKLNKKYELEFIVIDNHSTDDTPRLMRKYCEGSSQWRYVRFSRNFGIEASFSQGVDLANGDALIFLFSDMQDPPEKILDLIDKWEDGYDVVYGVINQRSDGRILEKIGAVVLHKLLNRLSNNVIPRNAADFQLITKPVINALRLCNEKNRYMRGLVHSLGFRKASVPFSRDPRKHGSTKMGLFYRINYAITSISAFSSAPLLMASIFGVFLTMLSFIGSILYFLSKTLNYYGIELLPTPPAGWTTLILLLLFFNGVSMLFLGVIGKYISNIYIEVKNRPISIVEYSIGIK